jgi:OmcA/MtrC family decaheme c-type cytochrome
MKWTLVAMVLVASTALLSTTKPPFTEHDKAFYADEAMINFVRPGLVFKILGQEIASDGTVKARLKITDPKGVPLEREGINTPGVISTSFILAKIPNNNKFYQTYTSRLKTSTYPPTAGKQARQSAADTGGTYAKVADGEYVYTFGYKLPADYEKNATHSIAVYGSRNLTEFEMSTNYATDIYTFVPAGTPVVKVRDVFETASCNKCHGALSFHGGSRVGMDVCTICHTPAYTLNNVSVSNLNPETDQTIDMTIMTHKIHMGSNLPSVIAGKPYQIIGFGNAISDFSYVNMPSQPNNCQWCHEKGNDAATQKDAWLRNPTRAACGACHDTVNFNTGEGHVGLPQPSDSQCANCHIPQGEIDFDASIKGAHVVPADSSLMQGAVVKILSVTETKAGQKPTITFSLTTRSGDPLTVADLIPGSGGRGRLAFTLAGPTTDYGTGIVSAATKGYIQEAPVASAFTGSPSAYKYTMATAIPADAKGTWVLGVEGRSSEKLLEGTLKERIVSGGINNVVSYFSADGTAIAPRRTVANTATCNNCHSFLSLHGANRNQVETCVICHNPAMTDAARRPADKMPAEAISMASMVHRIHTGGEQPNGYSLYGFGGELNLDHASFPPPGKVSNCNMCHTGNSQQLPAKGMLKVTDPRGWITTAGTATAACLSCHSSVDAASHALANTTTLGESCAACHGPTSEFSVNKVHAQ